MTELDTDL